MSLLKYADRHLFIFPLPSSLTGRSPVLTGAGGNPEFGGQGPPVGQSFRQALAKGRGWVGQEEVTAWVVGGRGGETGSRVGRSPSSGGRVRHVHAGHIRSAGTSRLHIRKLPYWDDVGGGSCVRSGRTIGSVT